MNSSIQSRLLLSASLILFCFLGLAGFVLDTAYQKGAENALKDRLQIHLYSILREAELDQKSRLVMPANLSEPRFSQVYSGLYAYIFNHLGEVVWRSSSSAGAVVQTVSHLESGQKKYIKKQSNDVNSVELHYKATLENENLQSSAFEFVVIESTSSIDHQVAGFRSVLWQWLGGIGLLLIILQFWIIRLSLHPLRHIVSDLEKIQAGDAQQLNNHYGEELKDIADTVNKLIENERTHLQRYRNTLADLAHSLKTPISVLIGLYEQGQLSDQDMKTFKSQTLLMWQLVDYQLQKAAVKGHQTMSAPIALAPIAQQVLDSLDKVYKHKLLKVITDFDKDIKFNIEKGDLFELFGNLLDNAYFWAKTQLKISIKATTDSDNSPAGITINIEDDGPGISAENLKRALQRGVKIDESKIGNGIGLAIVSEMLASYKGTLKSEQSELGGQKWVIFIPR